MPTLKMAKACYTGTSQRISLPCISLRIGRTDHIFVIDTGASGTVLCPLVFKAKLQGRLKVSTLTHSVTGSGETFRTPILFNFVGVSVPEVLLAELSNSLPGISGLIGNDILRQFSSVVFDFKNEVVIFNV